MKTAGLWGLLALLCQLSLGTKGHVLARPYSTGDLAQLKVRPGPDLREPGGYGG